MEGMEQKYLRPAAMTGVFPCQEVIRRADISFCLNISCSSLDIWEAKEESRQESQMVEVKR